MKRSVSLWGILLIFAVTALSFQNCSNSKAPDVTRKKSSSSDDNTNNTLQNKSCTLDSGAVLLHGETNSTDYYSSATAGCGQSCELTTVSCNDGVIEGNATSLSCNVEQCDAKTLSNNIMTGLKPNKKYIVNVQGLTATRSNGDTLGKVSIKTCQGIEIISTGEAPVNWHDGQAPQTASLAVTIPADGCIQAETDLGAAQHITAVETTDDAQTVSGNMISNLTAGESYLISVYGFTTNRGDGGRTLLPVSILDCADDSVISSTNQFNINWHDGQTSQEASMPIEAPASGCIKATTDLGDALNVTSSKIYKSAQIIAGNEVTLSQPGKQYYIHVYGLTENRGTGTNNLQAIGVTDCTDNVLTSTSIQSINWHDGQTAHSGGFVITAPADGCIRGITDIGPADQVTAIEL